MVQKTCDTQEGWRKTLAALPSRKKEGEAIPAFFFAHGHPGLLFPLPPAPGIESMDEMTNSLISFLKDFGPALLEKYDPKAIVMFSAHWETEGEQLVTDYGDDQPLLYDYSGYPDSWYEAKWHSNGSKAVSERVVELFKMAGMKARVTGVGEPRGEDGKVGPKAGLDHGVFVPATFMFPEGKEGTFRVPIIEVSMDTSLDPAKEIAIGKAVSALRKERVLILSGGLSVHTFKEFKEWKQDTASPCVTEWEAAIVSAAETPSEEARLQALQDLVKHPGFRIAHPREEHFAPIWVAAGAGSEGEARVVCDIHSAKTIAFGI